MPKRTFLILLITIMIVVAVSAVVIPGKIEQYRSLDKQDFQPRQYEIVTKTEEDGSVTYYVPLTISNNETGEAETKYFSANSKDLPALISVEVSGEIQHLLFNVDAEGKVSLMPVPEELLSAQAVNR